MAHPGARVVLSTVLIVGCGGSVSYSSDGASGGSAGVGATTAGASGGGGVWSGGSGGTAGFPSAGAAAVSGNAGTGGVAGTGASGGQGGAAGFPQCSPKDCSNGCCGANGVCLPGTDAKACGSSGNPCLDCQASGFSSCDAGAKACVLKQTDCKPENCQNGCCKKIGGASSGSFCFDGLSPTACGTGGQICSDCSSSTGTCDPVAHACGAGWCNGSNCANGCCLGSQCVSGADQLACGTAGAPCGNCAQAGMTCQVELGTPGGACKPPLCNTSNCPGCCTGDICAMGTQANACGKGGGACESCILAGKSCQNNTCQ